MGQASEKRSGRRGSRSLRSPRPRVHRALASRKVDEEAHLKPYKLLLADITASRSCLDKALEFANDLFIALESAGHRVVIAPPDAQFWRERIEEKEVPPKKDPRHDPYGYDRRWSPYRPTVAYVDSVAFGLAVIKGHQPGTVLPGDRGSGPAPSGVRTSRCP